MHRPQFHSPLTQQPLELYIYQKSSRTLAGISTKRAYCKEFLCPDTGVRLLSQFSGT